MTSPVDTTDEMEEREASQEYPLSKAPSRRASFNPFRSFSTRGMGSSSRKSFTTAAPPPFSQERRKSISFAPKASQNNPVITLQHEQKQKHRKKSLPFMDAPLNSSLLNDDLTSSDEEGGSRRSPQKYSKDRQKNDAAVPASADEDPTKQATNPRRQSAYAPPAPLVLGPTNNAPKERRKTCPAISNTPASKGLASLDEEEELPDGGDKESYLRSICQDQGIDTTGMDEEDMANALIFEGGGKSNPNGGGDPTNDLTAINGSNCWRIMCASP